MIDILNTDFDCNACPDCKEGVRAISIRRGPDSNSISIHLCKKCRRELLSKLAALQAEESGGSFELIAGRHPQYIINGTRTGRIQCSESNKPAEPRSDNPCSLCHIYKANKNQMSENSCSRGM